jgi:hypothetical protein
MFRTPAAFAAAVALAACGHVDAYEEAVYDLEPTYCYQSIGKAVCFREPYHRDAERLVNYYGPHPSRYDAPPAPPAPVLIAPADTGVWVKDPEPAVLTSAEEIARRDGGGVAPASAPILPAAAAAAAEPQAPAQVPAQADDASGSSWLFDAFDVFGDASGGAAAPGGQGAAGDPVTLDLSLEADPTALPKPAVDPAPLAPADGDVAPL